MKARNKLQNKSFLHLVSVAKLLSSTSVKPFFSNINSTGLSGSGFFVQDTNPNVSPITTSINQSYLKSRENTSLAFYSQLNLHFTHYSSALCESDYIKHVSMEYDSSPKSSKLASTTRYCLWCLPFVLPQRVTCACNYCKLQCKITNRSLLW